MYGVGGRLLAAIDKANGRGSGVRTARRLGVCQKDISSSSSSDRNTSVGWKSRVIGTESGHKTAESRVASYETYQLPKAGTMPGRNHVAQTSPDNPLRKSVAF